MKRIILMVLRLFYWAPWWFIKVCRYGKSDKYTEKERYDLLHNAMYRINRAGRVIIDAKGMENLPAESGYIMYPNHQGLFDTLALFESHEKPFTGVIKKEMENVFFVKQVTRLIKALFIDREDIRQSMKIIGQIADEVASGRRYVIFAEGTRSRQGNKLLDFKGGSFKAATKAKCPIVPVALIDAYKAFDTNSTKELTVKVRYLEPLYYDEYKDMKTSEIALEVKSRIEKCIEENE